MRARVNRSMTSQRRLRSSGVMVGMVAVAALAAQTPKPTFEVASIRANKTDADTAWNAPPGRFTATNLSLSVLIVNAYGIRRDQLIGGPSWINSDRFDISAKTPEGAPPDQTMLMLQSLLEDRFKLIVRRETRERSVYALVVARGDGRIEPQLTRTTDDCNAILAERNAAAGRGVGETSATPTPPARPVCEIRTVPGRTPGGGFMMTFSAGGQTIGALARALTTIVGRPVIDKTGLSGLFDYQLQFSPTPPLSASPDGAASSPTLDGDPANVFDSLRQLGLELQATRGPIDVLVIDSVQQPTDN